MSATSPPNPTFAQMSRAQVEDYLGGITAILDQDDDAITAAAAGLEGGIPRLIELLAAGMVLSFRPDRAEGQTGLVEMNIQTPDGQVPLWLDIDLSEVRVAATGTDPDTSLWVPLAVFVRVAFKRLTGSDAYMEGSVRAAGDVVLATTLDEWFDAPDVAAAEAFERLGMS